MSYEIVQNTEEGTPPPVPPVKANGDGYRYCMYLDNDSTLAFADSYEDLLNVLIPGYGQETEEDQAFERIRLAQRVAALVQAEILFVNNVTETSVSPEEWETLITPRDVRQPRADWWTCLVPLVVVETGYEPYTDIPRPASGIADGAADAANLMWVRPAEDEEFLYSLHNMSVITLLENADVD